MCAGTNCPLKEKCYRYKAKPTEWQSFFMAAPYNKETKNCDRYWEIETKGQKKMSIWKTPDIQPDVFRSHHIIVDYEAKGHTEPMLSTEYAERTADRYVNRWCYLDELITAADRAERLEQFADDAKKHIDGLNNMIDSWCKLILGDLPSKHSILKEAITTYCYERRQKETTNDNNNN